MAPCFHEALQNPLIQRGLKVSLWFYEAPQCHNGLLVLWDPALFHESLVPWGPAVSQWTPWFHGAESVTVAPWFSEACDA